jgi:hypothetical protein
MLKNVFLHLKNPSILTKGHFHSYVDSSHLTSAIHLTSLVLHGDVQITTKMIMSAEFKRRGNLFDSRYPNPVLLFTPSIVIVMLQNPTRSD